VCVVWWHHHTTLLCTFKMYTARYLKNSVRWQSPFVNAFLCGFTIPVAIKRNIFECSWVCSRMGCHALDFVWNNNGLANANATLSYQKYHACLCVDTNTVPLVSSAVVILTKTSRNFVSVILLDTPSFCTCVLSLMLQQSFYLLSCFALWPKKFITVWFYCDALRLVLHRLKVCTLVW
jgi:hypothetical protein